MVKISTHRIPGPTKKYFMRSFLAMICLLYARENGVKPPLEKGEGSPVEPSRGTCDTTLAVNYGL